MSPAVALADGGAGARAAVVRGVRRHRSGDDPAGDQPTADQGHRPHPRPPADALPQPGLLLCRLVLLLGLPVHVGLPALLGPTGPLEVRESVADLWRSCAPGA